MSFASLSPQLQQRWYDRCELLGLDPVRHNRTVFRYHAAPDLETLLRYLDCPTLANPLPSAIPPNRPLERMHDVRFYQAIVGHTSGVSPIEDPAVTAEISRRYRELPLQVMNATDITVSAQNPLIIDTISAKTNFGVVTFEPGGYIEIRVSCNFTCAEMRRATGPDDASGEYDIIIRGNPGAAGQPGDSGQAQAKAGGGNPGECDCCGGIATHDGTTGGDGAPGGNGSNGTNGSDGHDGPTVVMQIDHLVSTMTLLNVGGRGGAGGNGGAGGKGGDGGNGGAEKTCGAEFCKGGNGGNGGNGGDGGDGGNSGDGGNGSSSFVYFGSANGSRLLVTDGNSEAGDVGNLGAHGGVGLAGTKGGRGAVDGKPGSPGKPGKAGIRGIAGAAGNVQINPPTRAG